MMPFAEFQRDFGNVAKSLKLPADFGWQPEAVVWFKKLAKKLDKLAINAIRTTFGDWCDRNCAGRFHRAALGILIFEHASDALAFETAWFYHKGTFGYGPFVLRKPFHLGSTIIGDSDREHYEATLRWLCRNVDDDRYHLIRGRILYFRDKQDAAMFKLFWG